MCPNRSLNRTIHRAVNDSVQNDWSGMNLRRDLCSLAAYWRLSSLFESICSLIALRVLKTVLSINSRNLLLSKAPSTKFPSARKEPLAAWWPLACPVLVLTHFSPVSGWTYTHGWLLLRNWSKARRHVSLSSLLKTTEGWSKSNRRHVSRDYSII